LENSLKQVKFVASQTLENFLKIAKQAQFFSGSFPVQTFKLSFIINFPEDPIYFFGHRKGIVPFIGRFFK